MPWFFSIDGIDGVGKTTQQRLLAEWLADEGHRVVSCRDPGSTALGERLRAILLEHNGLLMGPTSQMLIYMAARAQMVEEVIRPALESGATVVSDRYLLANVAYQAYGAGLNPTDVWQIGQVAVHGILPHRTFVLDMPVEEARRRRGERQDRMEALGSDFLDRVRQGFLTEAAKAPDRIVVVDAKQPVDQVASRIRCLVRQVMATDH